MREILHGHPSLYLIDYSSSREWLTSSSTYVYKIKLYRSRFVKYLLTEHRNGRRSATSSQDRRDDKGARTFATAPQFDGFFFHRIPYTPYIPLGEREIFMLPENGTRPSLGAMVVCVSYGAPSPMLQEFP